MAYKTWTKVNDTTYVSSKGDSWTKVNTTTWASNKGTSWTKVNDTTWVSGGVEDSDTNDWYPAESDDEDDE